MAEKRVTNTEIGKRIEMHEGSISRLKNQDEMPYVNSELLSALCNALECAPEDLLEYVDDPSPK
jgi:DNA-binding Xre family transcriptional regulator